MMQLFNGIIFLLLIKSQSVNSHVIRVVQEHAEQTCAVNDSVAFDCGAAPSDLVTWYYSPTEHPWRTIQLSNGSTGTFVASGPPFNYSIVDSRGLHIEAVNERHSGRYTCQRTLSGGRWIQPINKTIELHVISGDGDVTLTLSGDEVGWRREWNLVQGLVIVFLISLLLTVFYKSMVARKFRREEKQKEDDTSTSGLIADQTDEFRYGID